MKVGFIAIGSAAVAALQFANFPPAGPTNIQMFGILASLIVAIGGIFVVITEQDAPRHLALAQEALEAAREAEARNEVIGNLGNHIDRLINLYTAQSLMRGVIELSAATGTLSEDDTIGKLLKAAERLLPIVMNFAQSDQWTICIYRAVSSADVGKVDLQCVASHRAITCAAKDARVWREGTGIAGVCYSNGRELIIPDLHLDGMKAVFGTAANVTRPTDDERYRSMAAVPISVHGMQAPWGVVSATSDRVGHFSSGESAGVRPEEGVRALANMAALAIAVIKNKVRPDS